MRFSRFDRKFQFGSRNIQHYRVSIIGWPSIGLENRLDAHRVGAEEALEQPRVSTHPGGACQAPPQIGLFRVRGEAPLLTLRRNLWYSIM